MKLISDSNFFNLIIS